MGGLSAEYLQNVQRGVGGLGQGIGLGQQLKQRQQQLAQQQKAQQEAQIGRQEFATGEREATQEFRAGESEKERQLKRDLALGKMKGKGPSKELIKAKGALSASVGLFSDLWSKKLGQLEATGADLKKKTGGGGRIKGTTGAVAEWFKLKGTEPIAAFNSQREDTILAYTRNITGQNRFIASIGERLDKSVPNQIDPYGHAEEKLAQSISNSYKIYKAVEKAGITHEDWANASTAELADINSPINQRLTGFIDSLVLSPEERAESDSLVLQVLKTPKLMTQAQQRDFAKESTKQRDRELLDKAEPWQEIGGVRIREKRR